MSVVGPPGVGKSTIARAAGLRLRDRFEGGVWWQNVSGLSDLAAMAWAFGALIGAKIRSNETAIRDLATSIGEKRMLLILDCCEGMRSAPAALGEDLLDRCPNVRILATSRVLLKAEGERVVRLKPLATSGSAGNLAEAMEIPAVALFVDRAQATDDEFSLADDDAGMIADLCRSLDGLPLAIEMVAARAPSIGLGVLHDRLAEFILQADSRLRSAFDFTWSLLGVRERGALEGLPAFAGTFSFEAAFAVSGSEMDRAAFVDCLGELVDHSLIVAEGQKDRRYKLLDTVKYYLEARLSEAELNLHKERVARYYIKYFIEASEEYYQGSGFAWSEKYGPECASVRGALIWAFSEVGSPTIAIELAAASARLWQVLHLNGENRYWLDLAVEAVKKFGCEPAIEALVWYGRSLQTGSADAQLGTSDLTRAVELYEVLGDEAGMGRSLAGLGMLQAFRGDLGAAESTLERARGLLKGSPALKSYGNALINLAYVMAATGRELDAILALQEAARAIRKVGDPVILGQIDLSLAELAFITGDVSRSVEAAAAAVTHLRDVRSPALSSGLANFARYLEASSDLRRAADVAAEVLSSIGDIRIDNLVGLLDVVALLGLRGKPDQSARLLGWIEISSVRRTRQREPGEIPAYDRLLDGLRAALDPSRLANRLREGESWDLPDVVAAATEILDLVRAPRVAGAEVVPFAAAK